jgi:dTDP-4-amino-4,6-dideoxygalactose transaminase
MIGFNIAPFIGTEFEYIKQAIDDKKICGDGKFTYKCNHWFEKNFAIKKSLLTTSCTHALEMCAILANIKAGDEVIMPSFTFVSTANAFVLRGAKIKFVDIRPDTMNIDEKLIEAAITSNTRVIVVVHYAGVACEMDTILDIAKKNNLIVVEDAAQGVMSSYKGRMLGSIGQMAAYSFHETKNYSMGEGGALLLNHPDWIERAEIIREKGTDRSKFFRNQVDKYSWVDIGSSYLPSEINAAYLWAQLEKAWEINTNRLANWQFYKDGLQRVADAGHIELPFVPEECQHNGHIFYIKTMNLNVRAKLIESLIRQGISAVFHYIPLHIAKAGRLYGEFVGEDRFTTIDSERLLRLPLYYGLKTDDVAMVIEAINEFYGLSSQF